MFNEFVGTQGSAQFLQSWQWGMFQERMGRGIRRIGVEDHGKLLGTVQCILRSVAFGRTYLYCPRGPVVDARLPVDRYVEVLRTLVAAVVEHARQRGAMFVKIEPPIEKQSRAVFDTASSTFNPRHAAFVQPQDTWLLDLTKSGSELQRGMHPKTRYNIRLAQKHGVTVRCSESAEDLEKFLKLNDQTSIRDRFVSHSPEHYRAMQSVLAPAGVLKLFIAEHNGTAIACNLVALFGDTATYLHGASANEHRNVMAPHLLQWNQIEHAKKLGFRQYDFWGVAPETDPVRGTEDWGGITRFKKGFGGHGVSYLGAYDLILRKPWYTLYSIARTVRSGS